MRGKKSDYKFISNFIENCTINGFTSIEQILNQVNSEISEIDKKIIEAESLKKNRTKLLDVKEFLNKKS